MFTRIRLLSVTTLAILISGAWPAHAGVEGAYCVACIDAEKAQPNPSVVLADYCGWVPDLAGRQAFVDRCAQLTDLTTVIWNPTNATSPGAADCSANLIESAVVCPPLRGVPALSSLNLFTLAVVQGALGLALLRRRRPRR